jgi:Tfp pilus assembly protein PilF
VERALAFTGINDFTHALPDLDAALKLDPEDLRAWRVRGAVRERLNDDHGAVADYSEALKRDPKDPRIYMARAAVYVRLDVP